MTLSVRGGWLSIIVLSALGGCTFIVDGKPDPVPEPPALLFPPDDRNVVMVGHRTIDLDLDGQTDVAIMNASTVPDDRGVFILLGGQDIHDLRYQVVVPTPAAPAAIAFGEAIDGGADGLELFVVDQLGELHVYTYVGGEQIYDPVPITATLDVRPEIVDTVSLDVGNFDDLPTLEAVVGIRNQINRVAPSAWNQGALEEPVQKVTLAQQFFDFLATVHEDDGKDSLLVGATDKAFWYPVVDQGFDEMTFVQDLADGGCRPLDGVTFVADRVEGTLGTAAAVRTARDGGDDVCITTVDTVGSTLRTRHWLRRDEDGHMVSPANSRRGFEAILFGDFTEGVAPEIVVLDRSELTDSQIAASADVSYDAAGDCFFSDVPAFPQVLTFINPEILIPIDFDADGEGELWLFEDDGSRSVCLKWAPIDDSTAQQNLGPC